MDNHNTTEYILLTNIEKKIYFLQCSSCLLSVNAMGMSIAVDACRITKHFETILEQWQECLPLGNAYDVNFALWGSKVGKLMQQVRSVYESNGIQINFYEYESESYLDFKNQQQAVGPKDDALLPVEKLKSAVVLEILYFALRELNEVLMEISEFLNSPTEELIAASYEKWLACYKKHYRTKCRRTYDKWKIGYSPRTLKKHVCERLQGVKEDFRKLFMNDDELEQVYDSEHQTIDYDGLSRFLFTHAERFGVSFIGPKPMFSHELLGLFNLVEDWRMMEADLQPKKKQTEKTANASSPAVDELEQKVLALTAKVRHLVAEDRQESLWKLWKRIINNFRKEISKAGPHEKFREFSKKTVYCIIGHLKSKGVYRKDATNVEVTKLLEGANNGMRKYLNNGLAELDDSLRVRIETFLEKELLELAA